MREFNDWWQRSDYNRNRLRKFVASGDFETSMGAAKNFGRLAYGAGKRHGRGLRKTPQRLSAGLVEFLRWIVFNPGLTCREIRNQYIAVPNPPGASGDVAGHCTTWKLEALELVGLIKSKKGDPKKGNAGAQHYRYSATDTGTYYDCADVKNVPNKKTGRNRQMFESYLYGQSVSALAKAHDISVTSASHAVKRFAWKMQWKFHLDAHGWGDLKTIREEAHVYLPLLNDRKKLWEARLL